MTETSTFTPFSTKTSSDAFGGADPSADTQIARACSTAALAEFVTGEVRVFNDAGGKFLIFFKFF